MQTKVLSSSFMIKRLFWKNVYIKNIFSFRSFGIFNEIFLEIIKYAGVFFVVELGKICKNILFYLKTLT